MPKRTKRPKRTLKKIKKKVKTFTRQPNRQVFFFDEARFGLQPQIGRAWTPKSVKPILTVQPRYSNFYVYSAVSPITGQGFTLFLPTVNTEVMNIYLKELSLAFPEEKILLIMDQAGWHKSKEIKKLKNIRIEFLPAYSPELNPIERLWQWLRRHACRNRFFKSEEEIMDKLQVVLKQLTTESAKSICAANYLLQ